MLTISLDSVALERDLNRRELPVLSIPFQLSWNATLELKVSIDGLYSVRQKALATLKEQEKEWDSVLETVDDDFMRQVIHKKHYKTIRVSFDYATKQIDISKSIGMALRAKRGVIVGSLSYVLTYRLAGLNKEVAVVAERYQRKMRKLLTLTDQTSYNSPTHLQEVSGDELWNKRCKAYDYAL